MEDEWERTKVALEKLRAVVPSAVPNRSLHSLYVHDDTGDALATIDLTDEVRALLPRDLCDELDALRARHSDYIRLVAESDVTGR